MTHRNPLVEAVADVLGVDPDSIDPNHVIDLDVVDVTNPDKQPARRSA